MPSTAVGANLQLIGQAQLVERIHLSRTQIWRLEKQGQFPSRILVGERKIGWRVADIDAWLVEREVATGSKIGPAGRDDRA